MVHSSILSSFSSLWDSSWYTLSFSFFLFFFFFFFLSLSKAYRDLLNRANHAGADVDTMNENDNDKVKEIIEFLTICYVSRAAPELRKMCHNISSFVINSE